MGAKEGEILVKWVITIDHFPNILHDFCLVRLEMVGRQKNFFGWW